YRSPSPLPIEPLFPELTPVRVQPLLENDLYEAHLIMTLLFHASVPFSKQIQLLPLNLLTSSIYFLLPIQSYHQTYHSKNRWTAAPLSQGKYRILEYPPLFSLI